MAGSFTFELVSPERLMVSEQVTQVVVPGLAGYFTVMANHAPTMASLVPGVVKVTPESGAEQDYVVFGGFVDVTPDGCTLLAESALPVKEINADTLDQRIRDAREDLNDAKDDEARTKAGALLDQLTTLQGALLPA